MTWIETLSPSQRDGDRVEGEAATLGAARQTRPSGLGCVTRGSRSPESPWREAAADRLRKGRLAGPHSEGPACRAALRRAACGPPSVSILTTSLRDRSTHVPHSRSPCPGNGNAPSWVDLTLRSHS